jgi:crotonobetainyl-CoA:carnitine CoA-transferase CaiB-like acyl-CoA transferase
MLLGDMGAEVIKVEEPGRGDDTRAFGPPFAGGEAAYYLSVNRNKQSLTLNLKAPEARGILRRLIRWADVLVENFRPGTMARLGLGYETVRRWNPRLVYCSISGFGESGPDAGRPGYDLIVQGESGLMDLTGDPSGPPFKVGTAVADLVSGIMAAHGIVLALYARTRTGKGQQVEVAMLDVVAGLLAYNAGIFFATGQSPTRRGNQHPTIVPYETFRASDGWLNIGVANDSLWARYCQVIERPDLRDDPRFASAPKRVEHRGELIPILDEVMAKRPRGEWIARLDAAGIPCGQIRSVGEVLESPHLRARGMIVSLPHPTAGRVTVTGVPIGLKRTPGAVRRAPPLLGQHTEEILRRVVGYRRPAIARLRQAGVV